MSLLHVVTGRWAGQTVSAIAKACRRSKLHVLRDLEAGIEPEPRGRRGPPLSPIRFGWGERHLPQELRQASSRELCNHFRVSPNTLAGWIRNDQAPHSGTRLGEQRRAWAARYLTGELRTATTKAIATHFGVSEQTIHNWIRTDRQPVHGGWPRGGHRGDALAPFIAELYARQPAANRLTRIFTARIGGG